MPMGFPLWGGFLTGLAAECEKTGEVAALLAEGKHEEAAVLALPELAGGRGVRRIFCANSASVPPSTTELDSNPSNRERYPCL